MVVYPGREPGGLGAQGPESTGNCFWNALWEVASEFRVSHGIVTVGTGMQAPWQQLKAFFQVNRLAKNRPDSTCFLRRQCNQALSLPPAKTLVLYMSCESFMELWV